MAHNPLKITRDYEKGVAFATLCYVMWGILPIYWKALDPINPVLIMFYRLIMAFLFVVVMALIIYKPKEILAPIKEKGGIISYLSSGILISFNWGIYIWAVNNGHILQASMGYYINPLITIVFGVLFFKERLNGYKTAALIIAGLGVLVMLIGAGQLPVIALSLALSFACYGVIKKRRKANAILALLYETAFLLPIALIVISYMEVQNMGLLSQGTTTHFVLIALAGAVTAIPLLLFAAAANRVDLTTIGFIQYVSPTISLLLGVLLYHEVLDAVKLTAFVFIWIALAIYVISEIKGKSKKEIEEFI